MRGSDPVRRSVTTIIAIALVLSAAVACSTAEEKPTFANCQAILTVGNKTYWGVEIGNEHVRPTDSLGRGALSACTDGTFAHHATGKSTEVYRLDDFATRRALVSPGGPGDPLTLWVKTTGNEPPYLVPTELQGIIDDNPVDQ